MPKDDEPFKLYTVFNGLPSESLDECIFEVEAWVTGSENDEKKLIETRLVRRLGGVPGALARRELHMPDLAKPEGYTLILLFLETKAYKKDALDTRLLPNRRYEAISRRPGQTLQDFLASENMTHGDAGKAGVGIDPDKRAYPMLLRCGLKDDQITHIHGFVHDPETPTFQCVSGPIFTTSLAQTSDVVSSSVQGWQGQLRASLKKPFLAVGGFEFFVWGDSFFCLATVPS